MDRGGWVYMLASKRNGTLYIGVTSDLVKRIWEHKQKIHQGFTQKYDVSLLVWFEKYPTIQDAILHEKRMKKRKRSWKIRLIEEGNAEWKDLYSDLMG